MYTAPDSAKSFICTTFKHDDDPQMSGSFLTSRSARPHFPHENSRFTFQGQSAAYWPPIACKVDIHETFRSSGSSVNHRVGHHQHTCEIQFDPESVRSGFLKHADVLKLSENTRIAPSAPASLDNNPFLVLIWYDGGKAALGAFRRHLMVKTNNHKISIMHFREIKHRLVEITQSSSVCTLQLLWGLSHSLLPQAEHKHSICGSKT